MSVFKSRRICIIWQQLFIMRPPVKWEWNISLKTSSERPLGKVSVDERITLKVILQKQYVAWTQVAPVNTVLTSDSTEDSELLLLLSQWLTASNGGPCYMEFVKTLRPKHPIKHLPLSNIPHTTVHHYTLISVPSHFLSARPMKPMCDIRIMNGGAEAGGKYFDT